MQWIITGALILCVTLLFNRRYDTDLVLEQGGDQPPNVDLLDIHYVIHSNDVDCALAVEQELAEDEWGVAHEAASGIAEAASNGGAAMASGAGQAAKWLGGVGESMMHGGQESLHYLRTFACAGGKYTVVLEHVNGLSNVHLSQAPRNKMFSAPQIQEALSDEIETTLTLTDNKISVLGTYSASGTLGLSVPVSGNFEAVGVGVNLTVPITAHMDGCHVKRVEVIFLSLRSCMGLICDCAGHC